jgi:anti-sigma B factor antagonist
VAGDQRWKLSEGTPSEPGYVCVEAITVERIAIVSVHGELDMAASPTVARQLLSTLGNDVGAIVLDLSGVTFMDSSGLGVLNITRTQAMHQGIGFRLRYLPDPVRRVLEVSDMLQLFEIEL